MCPKRQIISLYHDGELPSPWREKMEVHLKSCPECRAVISGYGLIGESLQAEASETFEAAQERVWKKLTSLEPATSKVKWKEKRGWNRNITLPLPLAAAAVLLIVVSLALVGIRAVNRPSPQDALATASIGLDDQVMVPLQDITGVLQYLSSQENGDFMVIRLPETRTFSRIGEPTLINAADYSRRSVIR